MKITRVFGHRGAASSHPENTLISFIRAEDVGADGIEMDVQVSKDGEIVVIHDEKLDRTTNGKGWVKDLTVKELKRLDASYKFSTYGRCEIPTLREVFEWASTNDLILNVELKNNMIPYEGIEEKVTKLIKEYKLEDRVILSSFNHSSMIKCLRFIPTIEAAFLYAENLFEPWNYAIQMNIKSLHPHYRNVRKEYVEKAHEIGVKVRPYTVNKKGIMRKLMKSYCDSIITDYPKEALELRNNIQYS